MKAFSKARRFVLQRSAVGLAAAFGAGILPWARARATEHLPKVSEDDPTAKRLQYVHDADANAVDVRNSGEYCNNCRYFRGDQDTEWAKCDLFPGKLVNAQGWCNVYSAK